jgi:phosphoglycerate dehydrogenase-like enzyme
LHDADYVIACVNYDHRSHHLFNEAALTAMKPGAYLINIARGGLVDQDALLKALESGHLAGAGLDVFWEEPVDPQHPLFRQNVVATPHIAGITDAFHQGGARALAENIARYVRGEPLRNVVNEPAQPRYPLTQ